MLSRQVRTMEFDPPEPLNRAGKKTVSSTGRLYVFEGANASGKTTLAQKLVDLLKSSGLGAEYFAFPGQTVGTLGKHVWEIHKDAVSKGIDFIHPASLQLMHIAAHVDAIETRILPA